MGCAFLIGLLLVSLSIRRAETLPAELRPRVRELGIAPGVFAPGPANAITDVPGVRVGHLTLTRGDDIRTGATAIVPHPGNVFQQKVPAAIAVGNGFGKLIGSTQVNELGQLETPILLTNTLNVWEAAAALADYTLVQPGNEAVLSVNPVVGETNDGWLSDIRQRPLRREHFLEALRTAASGPVEEGAVGAGTGTTAFGFKGGIGTASRHLPIQAGGYIIGVLVQTNFAGILAVDGVPVGKELGGYDYQDLDVNGIKPGSGSCMIVVATDAPLDAHELARLSRRALAGMARTGATFQPGSGDYVVAFSVAESVRIAHSVSAGTGTVTLLRQDKLGPLFEAAAEATEEAIYNSVLRATTVRGHQGHEARALPIDQLRRILKKYGRSEKAVSWLPDGAIRRHDRARSLSILPYLED
ncbi:MAG TPA: P1 family peptidase [Candidatus Acidoferrales bacterium]|nr:P1 family peptidase [Candidatus Acidoferrales bacterium]